MKIVPPTRVVLSLLVAVFLHAPAHAEEDETPLGNQMQDIKAALKGLRKAEDWDAKAALARKAQEACLNSLQHLPKTFEKITDEKEKAKATADYKRLIGLSYVALCQLEGAFLAEDQDAADAAIDKINATKKEGHDAYTEDD